MRMAARWFRASGLRTPRSVKVPARTIWLQEVRKGANLISQWRILKKCFTLDDRKVHTFHSYNHHVWDSKLGRVRKGAPRLFTEWPPDTPRAVFAPGHGLDSNTF